MTKKPRALSITPVPIAADMRALKIAWSLKRLGFESLVMADGQAPIPVEKLDLAAPQPLPVPGWSRFSPVAALRRGAGGFAGEAALFAGYVFEHLLRYQWLPRLKIPQAELYYLHSFEYHAALPRRRHSVVIYDAHDFYQGVDPEASLPHFDRHWVKPFARQREQQCVEAADAVVTVSRGVAELIARTFGCLPEVIRNAHDPRLENPEAGELRRVLGLDAAARLIVMVGNCKPNIELDLALAALRHLPDHVHLALVGRGYEQRLAGLPAALQGRVHAPGAVGAAQIVPYIRSADCGWLLYSAHSANSRNGLPNGFFQMLAAGLPLLYPDFPEIAALLGGRTIGHCFTGMNPAIAAGQIMSLLDQGGGFYRRNALALAEACGWQQEEERLAALGRSLFWRRGLDWPPAPPLPGQPAAIIPVQAGRGRDRRSMQETPGSQAQRRTR